jgi:hypothetical protein
MTAGLPCDRLSGAADDRPDDGGTARRVIARHDAEGDALDRRLSQRFVDGRTGDRRHRAGPGADQHTSLQCGGIQPVDALHEGCVVREIEIVDAVPNAKLRDAVVLSLKRPGRMDEHIKGAVTQHIVQGHAPIERPAVGSDLPREGIDRSTVACGDRQCDPGRAGDQTAEPAAEDAGPAEDQDAQTEPSEPEPSP